jgi:hypothetical protein
MPTKPTAMPSRSVAAKASRAKPLSSEPSSAASLEVVPLEHDPSKASAQTAAAVYQSEPLHSGVPPSDGARLPMWSGQQFTMLLSNYTTRHCHNSMATTAFNPAGDTHTWSELIELQQATSQRLMQQQMNGVNGLLALFQERGKVKQANTLSKWFEQEYYWFASLNALVASQATSMVNLMENIQVDYGYWVAQKTSRAC